MPGFSAWLVGCRLSWHEAANINRTSESGEGRFTVIRKWIDLFEAGSGQWRMRCIPKNLDIVIFSGVTLLMLWTSREFASAAPIDWVWASLRLLTGAVTLALATLYVLARLIGLRQALRVLTTTLVISWLAEVVGLKGHWLFGGAYAYNPAVEPVLPGGVPLFIPLSWFVVIGLPVMLLRSWRVQGSWRRMAWKSAAGALGVVACDLALDPVAVSAELWTWPQRGLYFGIPVLNFAAWWIVAFIILFISYGRAARARVEAVWVPIRFDLAWSGANGLLALLLFCAAFHRLGSGMPVLWSFILLLPLLVVWHRELLGKVKSCRQARSPI